MIGTAQVWNHIEKVMNEVTQWDVGVESGVTQPIENVTMEEIKKAFKSVKLGKAACV